MPSSIEISALLTLAYDILADFSGRKAANKQSIAKAHGLINHAFIQTYNYLKNEKGEYLPSITLAEAWNEAATATLVVDAGLGDILYHKSRFWLNPELYINLARGSEIIKLNEVVDEMERLRMKIK
ncbi:hypothetical protein [Daejeonella sp. H1SJ63]|uniref:hypothetical protein n=1 Tax=Daejeonella sp. H1SJ63 TaxID=3034145 RepID=UPI0023EDE04D|nr:hypothetical protein [Daejeonella sp. H1SJ63]